MTITIEYEGQPLAVQATEIVPGLFVHKTPHGNYSVVHGNSGLAVATLIDRRNQAVLFASKAGLLIDWLGDDEASIERQVVRLGLVSELRRLQTKARERLLVP